MTQTRLCRHLLMTVIYLMLTVRSSCSSEFAAEGGNSTSTNEGPTRDTRDDAGCPVAKPCDCQRSSGRLVIYCLGKNLDRIPAISPSDELVDELTLAGNYIHTLPDGGFRGLKVRRLDLKGNQILQVSSLAFSGVEEHLEELRIQLDSTAEFPSAALEVLADIRVLDVIGYGGTSLPAGALWTLGLIRELRLTTGGLRSLSAGDLSSMRATVSLLDLSGNPLGAVPTPALGTLSNLTELLLSGCHISRLGPRVFATNWTRLETVDLSQNQLQTVHQDAFRDVGDQSIRQLSIRSSHLEDSHLPALLPLTKLRSLDIALNTKVTSVDQLLDSLPSLETLDASSDGLLSLGRPYRSHVRSLNVADNPLTEVAFDAFLGMSGLEELKLDGARLLLADDSFIAQQSTLKTLSLRRCNFTRTPWPSVARLHALETLYMSQCSLRSVPELVFTHVRRLQTLDLSSNELTQLTPRSLVGLNAQLEIIKLDSNKLTTLDRCLFYRFDNIDYLKLGLSNNPLQCICGLQWLHERLKTYSEEPWYPTIQWQCTDLDDKKFIQLVDADFSSCAEETDAVTPVNRQCEDLIPPTTAAPTHPLLVTVVETTSASITVTWSVDARLQIVKQEVVHWRLDDNVKMRLPVPVADRRHVLGDLDTNATFVVCVQLEAAGNGSGSDDVVGAIESCVSASTLSSDGPGTSTASLELIIGVSVGCGLAAVIIVSLAVYCCCAARRGTQDPVTSPVKRTGQTKRFRKLGTVAGATGVSPAPAAERTSNPYSPAHQDMDRAIDESVERLDPQSKEVLVNLLRSASAECLDRVGGVSYYPSPNSTGGGGLLPSSAADKHFYEELPDDDQIPTDDFV